MKPLPANRPDLWSQQHRACTLRVSRAELERRLGPALVHDAGDGLGTRYRWGFQFDCGLEVLIDLPRQSSPSREAVIWMEYLEVEHALAHLGLSTNRVLWRADMQDPLPLEGWAVVRQADADNRFDMCVLSIRDHAECLARLMEEARAYEQSYDVERRGTPPRVAPRRAPDYFAESIAS